MNGTRQLPSRWQLLLSFVVFIVVLGLAYFFREQIAEIVLVPILYSLWIVDLVLQMFGQQCIWFLALIIALVLSLAYSRRREKPVRELDRTIYGRAPATGRIHFWRRRVRVNSGAIIAISYRRSEMRRLVIQALANRENKNDYEIEEQLLSGELQVPAEVSHILGLDDQRTESYKSMGIIEHVKLRYEWIADWFVPPKYSPDPRVERVVDYLEGLMEVDDDIRNH